MVERGPKLRVDKLLYQSKMIFLALLIIRSNFFSSKTFFPTKEQNNEKLGQNLRLGPCLAMCLKKDNLSLCVLINCVLIKKKCVTCLVLSYTLETQLAACNLIGRIDQKPHNWRIDGQKDGRTDKPFFKVVMYDFLSGK